MIAMNQQPPNEPDDQGSQSARSDAGEPAVTFYPDGSRHTQIGMLDDGEGPVVWSQWPDGAKAVEAYFFLDGGAFVFRDSCARECIKVAYVDGVPIAQLVNPEDGNALYSIHPFSTEAKP